MRQNLKKHGRQSALALGLAAAFGCAAGVPPEEKTYWHIPDYDAVFEISRCAPQSICTRVHSLNPDDPKIVELATKAWRKDARSKGRPAPQRIGRDHIMFFCGFEARFNAGQTSQSVWDGSVVSSFNGKTYGITATFLSQDNIRLRAYLPNIPIVGSLLGRTVEAKRLDTPPPACTPAQNPPRR